MTWELSLYVPTGIRFGQGRTNHRLRDPTGLVFGQETGRPGLHRLRRLQHAHRGFGRGQDTQGGDLGTHEAAASGRYVG